MAGLDPAIQRPLLHHWMAASEGGHDVGWVRQSVASVVSMVLRPVHGRRSRAFVECLALLKPLAVRKRASFGAGLFGGAL